MSLVADVQLHLQQAGIIDGSSGWPSVRRYEHDDTDRLVILQEDGGFEPEVWSESGIGDSAIEEPAIQIRVRGAPGEGDATIDKAIEIKEALHSIVRQTVGYNVYMRIRAQTPAPIYIGIGERERPACTISFRAARRVAALTS